MAGNGGARRDEDVERGKGPMPGTALDGGRAETEERVVPTLLPVLPPLPTDDALLIARCWCCKCPPLALALAEPEARVIERRWGERVLCAKAAAAEDDDEEEEI